MIIIPFDKNCNDSTVTIIMKLFRQANIWTKYVKIHCQLSYISLLILSNLSKNKDRKMWGGLGKLGIMLYAWLSMSGYLLYWNLLVYREMHLQCWSVRHYWIFFIFLFFFFWKKNAKYLIELSRISLLDTTDKLQITALQRNIFYDVNPTKYYQYSKLFLTHSQSGTKG